jgi:hypothetical protein
MDDAQRNHPPKVERIATRKSRIIETSANILVLLILLGTLFLSVTAIVGGPGRDMMEARQEAESYEYEDMGQVAASCPPLAREAARAMSDGRITNLEVRRVAEAMYAARDAMINVEEKNRGYEAIGAKTLPLPPECHSNDLFPTYETRRGML